MRDGEQQRILLSPPDVGEDERAALVRAFDSGWIAPLGAEVDAFELELAEYVGAEACVALASGSAGLRLGLLAVGVKPNDEVLVQSATFAASAFAVAHVGARPTFVDSCRSTWTMDPSLLRNALAERQAEGNLPAAVLPVDLYGLMSDYEQLSEICEEYGVPIVADAAESLGSSSALGRAGSLGACGVVSFNGNKIMTTSGGGAFFGTKEMVSHVRYLSTQAREPKAYYEHLEIGYNDRMSNILAALGRAQLEGLDQKIERRQETLGFYKQEVSEIEWAPMGVTERYNSWLAVGLLPKDVSPLAVCESMGEAGVEARPAWKPMHQQPVFSDRPSFGTEVSDLLFARGICLPSGSTLQQVDRQRVVDTLKASL